MRDCGGFRMGPFELMDLIGNDVNLAVTKSVFEAFFYDPRFRPSLLQQELVDAGWFGRKTGRGWYEYGESVQPPAPETEPTIRADVDGSGVREALAATGSYGDILVSAAIKDRNPNAVVFDLALDYRTAKRIAVAKGQCSAETYSRAVALLQSAGFSVTRVPKASGMPVFRIVSQIVDEAARTVNEGVCTVEALNTAMRKGVNYPIGPLEWADRIGLQYTSEP